MTTTYLENTKKDLRTLYELRDFIESLDIDQDIITPVSLELETAIENVEQSVRRLEKFNAMLKKLD